MGARYLLRSKRRINRSAAHVVGQVLQSPAVVASGWPALRVVYIAEMTVDPFDALVRITS
jgi:hypothetical protein